MVKASLESLHSISGALALAGGKLYFIGPLEVDATQPILSIKVTVSVETLGPFRICPTTDYSIKDLYIEISPVGIVLNPS
jgi:hypothetical protein